MFSLSVKLTFLVFRSLCLSSCFLSVFGILLKVVRGKTAEKWVVLWEKRSRFNFVMPWTAVAISGIFILLGRMAEFLKCEIRVEYLLKLCRRVN